MRSSASDPAGPHGRLVKKCKSGPYCWEWKVSTQFTQQLAKTAVTTPPLVGCVVWRHSKLNLVVVLFIVGLHRSVSRL